MMPEFVRYTVAENKKIKNGPSPSTTSNTHADDISSSEAPTPTSSPRKESNNTISSTTTSSNSSGTGTTNSTTATTTTSTTNANTVNRTLTKKQQREIAPCKLLLEQLEQQDEAWPFLLPVNTKQFPTYKKIIKTPMDLSTIKKKLQDTAYKSRDEFCADVRQMFINCEVFNEDDSPVGKAGHGMRTFFETKWTEMTGAPPPPLHQQTHS